MKTTTRTLFLASLLGLTVAANGATSFTENFSDNSAGPNMVLGLNPTNATTSFASSNFTITTGSGPRIFLGTNDTNYNTVNFTFEADVTIPNITDAGSIAFLGMGNTTPVPTYYEPVGGSNIISTLRNNENQLQSRDNGAFATHGTVVLTAGSTHGMRMEWNATSMLATFMFDLGNDGTYDTASTYTLNGSNNGFTASNSQLFVGGGNGLIFDNIVVSVPEPSAALLGGLGLALMRRRRI